MSLFGTSGIRMLAADMTDRFCSDAARALATFMHKGSRICIANDTRLSGPRIKRAFISGITASGADAIDLGLLTTPALAYLSRQFDAAVMLTASHNPPEYNGIKLWKNGMGFTRDMESDVEALYESKDFRDGDGDASQQDLSEKYIGKVVSMTKPKHLKLLIDAGNGAASILAPKVFGRLGYDVIKLFCEPDGNFPNRNPEPRGDTLTAAAKRVKSDADIGIAFDGDADRVVFVDKHGFMGFNEPIAFAAMLKVMHSSRKTVVTTVETGMLLDHAIEPYGGEVIRTKVGDVAVAVETHRQRAAFGCEQVGVYIMPEFGFFPSTIYASAWLMENGMTDMRRELKVPNFYFEKIKLPVKDRASAMAHISEQAKAIDADVNTIDGVRIDFEDSWMLIRASGTEPVIRVIAEARDKRRMRYLIEKGRKMVIS